LRAVLIPVRVWHDIVQALVRPLPARRLALADAEGCVLARAVQTLHPLPPFDASAMDGYAVRARDVLAAGPAHPVRLRVIASAPAGHPVGAVVGAGDAVRILTGGQLPAGGDSGMEALRVLKRRLSDVVYAALRADLQPVAQHVAA